jgi:formamidopyrimidine-DNA glycosylase
VPELPEVETTRRSLAESFIGATVSAVVVRQHCLRQPVPADLGALLQDQPLLALRRRAKYLLLDFPSGSLIVHLGMSGSLRRVAPDAVPRPHDHVDIAFGSADRLMRYHDPRRFGLMVWGGLAPEQHPLLARLGLEPLEDGFTAEWLYRASRDRNTPLKQFLMDPAQVVGIGNIYAAEALFRAGLSPLRRAGKLTRPACMRLRDEIRATLQESLDSGGSTLRDYVDGGGVPGEFQQLLKVYGRAEQPCLRCGGPVRQIRQAQRSTFYCPRCQR